MPAEAKLFIDNTLTQATSERRNFVTPELQKDVTYFYVLRAEVVRDGKTVSESKRVTLKAGDVVRAKFELSQDAPAVASR